MVYDLCDVLKVFKSFNPQTIILLMLFAIGLKLGYFIHPPAVSLHEKEWGFVWLSSIIEGAIGSNAYLMVFLGIFNLVLQALVVNRLASEYKLFSTESFVPAALFLLISSLIPEWNTLSAPLLANWLVLFTLNNLLRLPFTATPKKLLFNCGLFISLATLIYYPAILIILFAIWALLILQTLKIKDILIVILGFLTPVYFLIGTWYLLDKPLTTFEISSISVQSFEGLKIFPSKIWTTIAVITLLVLLSMYHLNNAMNKHIESGKKMWWIVIAALIIGNITAIVHIPGETAFWYFCLAPITLLSTNIWMADTNKWIKIALFWIILAAIIYIQYF